MADLTASGHRGDGDVVVGLRDLVGGVGEREHRLDEPPRQVPREGARNQDPAEEREREPLDQTKPAAAKRRFRRRHDERPEDVAV